MRRWVFVLSAFILAGMLLSGCGKKSASEYQEIIGENSSGGTTSGTSNNNTGTTDPASQQPAQISLMASKLTIKSNGTDSTELTVIASDSDNAAMAGEEISLKATGGLLSASQVVTDADGTAKFTFSAGAQKKNQVVTITASAGDLQKSIPITIVGTTLSLIATPTAVKKDVPDGITITGQALDANGKPIYGEDLVLTSAQGNTLSGMDQSGTPVSGNSITLTTDVNGSFQATFTGNATGEDTVTLEGLGSKKQVPLAVTNASSGFISPADGQSVQVGGTVSLVALWVDDQGNPLAGKALTFVASHGSFEGGNSSVVATTDETGKATVTYQADNIATPASILVTEDPSDSKAIQDTLSLSILASDPNRLDLQSSPTVLPPSIGDVSSTSTITAVVRDENNNLVQGQLVTFKILDGPGSGESIWPLVAVTDAYGQAKTTFTSGGTTSGQYKVKVQAVVDSSNGPFSDEVDLTVGREAARIVLGTTNRIEVISKDGIEVGYGLPITVLVTDNNGNPIPGQKVNLGIYPTQFRTGYWQETTDVEGKKTYVPIVTGVFANEDVNRNGILDPGEDSVIANNMLDPGNVGSIPSEVITDENGLASFEIVYAKSYGIWVDMEVSALTQVSGSETMARLDPVTLGWVYKEDGTPDLPVIDSPFGQ